MPSLDAHASPEESNERRVTVVGAGFSGLVAAHYLSQAGFRVDVREASARPGGLIRTLSSAFGPVEMAANGILNSPAVEELFEAVGVEMRSASRSSRARYIFRFGRACRWPLTWKESISLAATIIRFSLNKKSLAPREGETLAAWGERAFSDPSIGRHTLETAFQGVYAGDPARLSASLVLSPLFEAKNQATKAERKSGIRGTVAPPGGMGELIEGLFSRLRESGVEFSFSSPVGEEEIVNARHPVVIATSSLNAANLLVGVDPERASALLRVETLPLVTATVNFPSGSMPITGFGCLFPPGQMSSSAEERSLGALGVLFNHHIFEGRGYQGLSETWILGGALFPGDVTVLEDQAIIDLIRKERQRLTGGNDVGPLAWVITRWPAALPHYTVALERDLPRLNANSGNIFLVGNYLGGIGLSRIVEQTRKLPREIARSGTWINTSARPKI